MTNKGKAIYQPAGKAAEYSKWAVNFYNGCSSMCAYCYNRHGITAKVLGADVPSLKKCLIDEETALLIFAKELFLNHEELKKHGLFFNFVSDPFLKETIDLNMAAIENCVLSDVPVKILTKQTWWLEKFLSDFEQSIEDNPNRYNTKHLYAFGFTLTGHDELEPGAATNADRIRVMKVLNSEGFKTWASIEPIIDILSSKKMIREICNHVDLVKIGLQSGKAYDEAELLDFSVFADNLADIYGFKIYLKDSFIKQSGLTRERLNDNYVTRDYNIFLNG